MTDTLPPEFWKEIDQAYIDNDFMKAVELVVAAFREQRNRKEAAASKNDPQDGT
ncbi:hypothetical protein [Crateriforma conspicua]|uniref:Uncharacterized protein n=1 Tax=Crateriforma conspicua TaxID=2527996 RepID=A0A5C6FIY1_9PLAN|nr:hypothetical protein [Crateriforma conspicua]TWU59626.1 hypothetical protein V7x_55360 [Crateriforma conspicua]